MVTEATGESSPSKAMQVLRDNPEAMIKLEEIAKRDEADIRLHHREMLRLELEDAQAEHATTQKTIQSGDNATDEYVRRTRPKMARQSWYATMAYIVVAELLQAFEQGSGAEMALAAVLIAPASAYMGMRTVDKWRGKV
jgi:fibronectin type 3 domain-containing protein